MTSPGPHSLSTVDPEREARLREARSTARTVARRLHNRQVRIRRTAFIRNEGEPLAPLTALLSGRGLTDKPLKLAILASWLAGSVGGGDGQGAYFPPEPTDSWAGPFTARIYLDDIADLLLLPFGAESERKIRGYLDRVAAQHLIEIAPDYDRFRLLSDDGSQAPYTDPGANGSRQGTTDAPARNDPYPDRYVTLPSDFFRNGWLSAMPGYALLTLLVILGVQRRSAEESRRQPEGGFVNESFLRDYVGISPSSYERGIRLLRNWGVLDTVEEVIRRSPRRRSRYLHSVRRDAFQLNAPDEPPVKDPKLDPSVRAVKVPRSRTSRHV